MHDNLLRSVYTCLWHEFRYMYTHLSTPGVEMLTTGGIFVLLFQGLAVTGDRTTPETDRAKLDQTPQR